MTESQSSSFFTHTPRNTHSTLLRSSGPVGTLARVVLLGALLLGAAALAACGNPFAEAPDAGSGDAATAGDTAADERVAPEDQPSTVEAVTLPEDPGSESLEAEQAAADELAALDKELELRERELALREKELELKERELAQRRRESRPAPPPTPVAEEPAPTPEPAREEPAEVASVPSPEPVSEPARESQLLPVVTWLEVPAGREMDVEFLTPLASNTSRTGDSFRTRVLDPIYAQNGELAIPGGSEVLGHVVEASTNDRRIGGRSRLELEFTDLVLPSGSTVPIEASFAEESKSGKKKDAATIGGAAAVGAILGRILGDGDSAVVGAIIGGAAGTAIASRNKGETVEIPEGFAVRLRLDEAVAVRVVR